jgi:hypothetical protein
VGRLPLRAGGVVNPMDDLRDRLGEPKWSEAGIDSIWYQISEFSYNSQNKKQIRLIAQFFILNRFGKRLAEAYSVYDVFADGRIRTDFRISFTFLFLSLSTQFISDTIHYIGNFFTKCNFKVII